MAATQPPQSNGWTNRDYSPRRQPVDAQQQAQLEQVFNDLRIRDVEVERLREFQRRLQTEEAELKENSLAKIHHDALEKARKDRDEVRERAEAVLQTHLREEEERRRQREQEEKQRLQREAELTAAKERARLEEEKRKLLEQKRLREEAEAKAELERQRQDQIKLDAERLEREKLEEEKKKQQQEREKLERDEAARVEAAKEAERKVQADAQAAAAAKIPATAGNESVSAEQTHQEYIALYLKLKKWNNDYWDTLRQASKPANKKHIKNAASDARGIARTEIGKLSYGDRVINRTAENKLTQCLESMLSSTTPEIGKQIPVNFFLPPSLSLNDNDQTTISDQAAYFIYNVAKQIVKIFCTYVTVEVPERAEPIGTMVTKFFGNSSIQFTRHGDGIPESLRQQSLFPILLAKYHKVCPALFGVTAPDTPNGRLKMGWALAPTVDDSPKSQLIDEAKHFDRIAGLAIGYSAFALRNASTVKLNNPYPPKHFWTSLAQMVNLSPGEVQQTHLCVLKNMFGHDGVKRFLLFYGDVGVALLREALVKFPKRLPASIKGTAFYKELVVYVEQLEKVEQLHLT